MCLTQHRLCFPTKVGIYTNLESCRFEKIDMSMKMKMSLFSRAALISNVKKMCNHVANNKVQTMVKESVLLQRKNQFCCMSHSF